MANDTGKGSNGPDAFTFVMECKDSGAYQTFHQEAETRDEARPKLEKKASDAGWDLSYCKVL